jgi:prevent-host-death family protein
MCDSVRTNQARTEHQPVCLARRGRTVAAVIDAEDLDRILEWLRTWPISG